MFMQPGAASQTAPAAPAAAAANTVVYYQPHLVMWYENNYRPLSRGDNTSGRVRLSVVALLFELFDL